MMDRFKGEWSASIDIIEETNGSDMQFRIKRRNLGREIKT